MGAVCGSQRGVPVLRLEEHGNDWHEGGTLSGKVAGASYHPRAPQLVELLQGLPGCVCVVANGVQGTSAVRA